MYKDLSESVPKNAHVKKEGKPDWAEWEVTSTRCNRDTSHYHSGKLGLVTGFGVLQGWVPRWGTT